jgi:hypothetical protein
MPCKNCKCEPASDPVNVIRELADAMESMSEAELKELTSDAKFMEDLQKVDDALVELSKSIGRLK